MPATLKDYKDFEQLMKDTKEIYEEFESGGYGSDKFDKRLIKNGLRILSHDYNDYLLVHYEEHKATIEDPELSKEYREQYDIRTESEEVHLLHEYMDEVILYVPNTQSLFIILEKETGKVEEEPTLRVGIFEHSKRIAIETTRKQDTTRA